MLRFFGTHTGTFRRPEPASPRWLVRRPSTSPVSVTIKSPAVVATARHVAMLVAIDPDRSARTPTRKSVAKQAVLGGAVDEREGGERAEQCTMPTILAVAMRLAVSIPPSVTSDAEEKVPTGGELTPFEAVGPGSA